MMQWYFTMSWKGLHKSVAYLVVCCPECLTAVLSLLNASAASKVVCENLGKLLHKQAVLVSAVGKY